jgi:hypothetical protein
MLNAGYGLLTNLNIILMFNLLIKKEYRNKFKFTNFLYNDLWSLCEQYFEHIDEQKDNATTIVNAMVASYNIVLYCGRTAIDDNTKIDVKNFIVNQLKQFSDEPMDRDVSAIFYPSGDNSILLQLFNVTEKFLIDLKGEELLKYFQVLKEKSLRYLSEVEMHNVMNH